MPENPATSSASQSYSLALSCPDRPGIVHAVTGALVAAGCNITESQQYGSDSGRFFMRVQVDTAANLDGLRACLAPVASEFGMDWGAQPDGAPVKTLIMASRDAHCLNDLLFRQRSGLLPITVEAIVSNHPDLADLAAFYSVPFHHIPVTAVAGTRDADTGTSTDAAGAKEAAESRLRALIAEHEIDLVVLARYMQILSDDLCRDLSGKAINIHHSFLPSFKGARPYNQAHARGVKLIGATAHYVTADLDEGPIIEQEVLRVSHSQSPQKLVAMGRDVEARTLSQAVQWHAEHRVLLDGRRTVVFD